MRGSNSTNLYIQSFKTFKVVTYCYNNLHARFEIQNTILKSLKTFEATRLHSKNDELNFVI